MSVRVSREELLRLRQLLEDAGQELAHTLRGSAGLRAGAADCPAAAGVVAEGLAGLERLSRELSADAERMVLTSRGYEAAERETHRALRAAGARLVTSRQLPGGPAPSPARGAVLERARRWAENPVPYNMSGWHEGWRADCSGYVSMAWGLDRSYTTVDLPTVSRRIGKDELRPGDILLNRSPGGAGHVVLFDRWADAAHTAYVGYEQSPGGTKHRVIPYPYFAGHGAFHPYRKG